MSMEVIEYLPGALAAGWMAFRLVAVLRHGRAASTAPQATWE